MVASQDEVIVGFMLREVAHRLSYGVGRSLIPVGVVRCLFGCKDFNEPARENVEAIGATDVAVDENRVKLRQNEDATDLCMQTAANGHVNQAVLATDRHGGLRACGREWKQ